MMRPLVAGTALIVGSLIRPALSNDRTDRAQRSQLAPYGRLPAQVDSPMKGRLRYAPHLEATNRHGGPIVGQK